MNHQTNIKKPTVLIVEDEIESQKFFELILRKKYSINFCDSKKSMNILLNKNEYDAVIMDISLKDGSNGVDLIKEIRQNSTETNIPIICISGHVFGENKLKAELAGADLYLTKPIKSQVLVNNLEKLLNTNLPEKKYSKDRLS